MSLRWTWITLVAVAGGVPRSPKIILKMFYPQMLHVHGCMDLLHVAVYLCVYINVNTLYVCMCLCGEPSCVSHTVVYGSHYDSVNVALVNKRRLSVHLLN